MSLSRPVPRRELSPECGQFFPEQEVHYRVLSQGTTLYSGYGYDEERIVAEYERPCHDGVWKPVGISGARHAEFVDYVLYFALDKQTADRFAGATGIVHEYRVQKDCRVLCTDITFSNAGEVSACICRDPTMVRDGIVGVCVAYAPPPNRDVAVANQAEFAFCDPKAVLTYIRTHLQRPVRTHDLDSVWPYNPDPTCGKVSLLLFCQQTSNTLNGRLVYVDESGSEFVIRPNDDSACRTIYDHIRPVESYEEFLTSLSIEKGYGVDAPEYYITKTAHPETSGRTHHKRPRLFALSDEFDVR